MKLVVLLFGFCWTICFTQVKQGERFYFYVNIANYESLNISTKGNGTKQVTNNKDSKETKIYSNNIVYSIELAFPNTDNKNLKTSYRIVTNSKNLVFELQNAYPKKYTRIIEFSPPEKEFYPNDYGNTSPYENLGNPYSSEDLDLINAPGAWAITKGDKKVIIGISDSRIDTLNPDMQGRILKDLYVETSLKKSKFDHGTNVAGIAVARMDNAYGRPGICSECGVIAHRYGSFKQIEELVAAGAKVINASWASCQSEGNLSNSINNRIKEYYDDGIIIVAAAGNGRDCNNDKNSYGDLLYPASYDKVISVSGVYAKNRFIEDDFYTKDGVDYTFKFVDRRNYALAIDSLGNFYPSDKNDGLQLNTAIDLMAPREGYLLGNDLGGKEVKYGGASSSSAPYVTGLIGLMWSVNYCLSSYEIESILKLTSANIEDLPGNEPFKGMLGSGRIDAYQAVKMAQEMKLEQGNVQVQNRNFYRFDFRLERALNTITIKDQVFREETTVDFTARKKIIIKPNSHFKPNSKGFIKLFINPEIPQEECFPTPPKKYVSIYK
ncbi:MAG: S8/S53 family peptidase [Flavobacteriaceae bacterium]|nr:S8/S53 family peptidase [Flavobacteriaceae bacterium]